MKKYILYFILMFYSILNHSQIVEAEYFFDTDPGIGNATPLTINGNTVNQNFSIPTNGLSQGIHKLYTRVKKANGNWSLYDKNVFYINPSQINTFPIVEAEYFFDTDPGIGNATPLTTNGNTIEQNFSIPTNGISQGVHKLYVRIKKTDGNWSLYDKNVFYINPNHANNSLIIAMEYFFNTDPGVGNATNIDITDTQIYDNDLTIQVPNDLNGEEQRLYLRVLNASGKWSIYAQSETLTLSSEYFVLNDFKLYPNPVKETFRIETDLSVYKVNVFDNLGKIVLKFNQQESYDVSNLTSGMYFIIVKSNDKSYRKKLIIN